ncbi:RNA 2',3'-cyclic phosphodiesterase [Candidatus Woesearchaeota archaeon]|nr:RNA 2',3'-cyclic phosphodiesterase [Candidatus Woesearchaeota archaeon]
MRIFISIELPGNVKDYLFDFCKKIKSNNIKVNWVHKKNLHLTLKFIGEVNDNEINEIIKRLSEIKLDKINVNLSNLGFFPKNDFVRVIWVGIEPKDKILELQRKIDSSLLDLFSKDQKFETHLTLGRIKSIKNKNEFFNVINNLKIEKTKFEIYGFKLMKSTLSKDGPTYEEIANFVL